LSIPVYYVVNYGHLDYVLMMLILNPNLSKLKLYCQHLHNLQQLKIAENFGCHSLALTKVTMELNIQKALELYLRFTTYHSQQH